MKAEVSVPADALAAIRAPFLQVGATPIDPAVIQPLNLLLDLAGEAMRARLFIVQDEGGREACLRPDFTVPVARAHLEGGAAQGRYLYEGKAFRVAPKNAADVHAEEFLQIGLEAYGGDGGADEDAMIAGLAWRAASAGGRADLSIRLGDIALLAAFLEAIGVPEATAVKLRRALARPRLLQAELDRAQTPPAIKSDPRIEALARLPRDEAEIRLKEIWQADGLEAVGGRSAAEIVARLSRRAEIAQAPRLTARQADLISRFLDLSGAPEEVLAAVAALSPDGKLTAALQTARDRLSAMESQGVPASRTTFAPGFGRAFGYYDGFLFEIASASLPSDAPIAAGGRYDGLIAQLGGQPGRAVGCIVRPARAHAGGGQ